MNITRAAFVKVIPNSAGLEAEVDFEAQTEAGTTRFYSAVLRKTPSGDYEMSQMFEKDADYEVDWYDNSFHQAYSNVTDAWQHVDHALLVDQLLKHSNVRTSIEAAFSKLEA